LAHTIKPGHPVPYVANEQPALGDLTVVDHVHARGDLLVHHLGHRCGQRLLEVRLGRRPAVKDPLQLLRPGQRARV
jgi:hypothetical protein